MRPLEADFLEEFKDVPPEEVMLRLKKVKFDVDVLLDDWVEIGKASQLMSSGAAHQYAQRGMMPDLVKFQAIRAMIRKVKDGKVTSIPEFPDGAKLITQKVPFMTYLKLVKAIQILIKPSDVEAKALEYPDEDIETVDIVMQVLAIERLISFAFREFAKEIVDKDNLASHFWLTIGSGNKEKIEAMLKED